MCLQARWSGFWVNPTAKSLVFAATHLVGWFLAPPLGIGFTSGRCSDLRDTFWHRQKCPVVAPRRTTTIAKLFALRLLATGINGFQLEFISTWVENLVCRELFTCGSGLSESTDC